MINRCLLVNSIVLGVMFLFYFFISTPKETFIFFPSSSLQNTNEPKYISMVGYGGRLGNNIFRFATLFGIGKRLGRIPYLPVVEPYDINENNEMFRVFPLVPLYYPYKPNITNFETVNFTSDCCKYEELPNDLFTNKAEYLKLSSGNLQVPRYFENVKDKLLKIMQCSDIIKQQIYKKAEHIWKTNNSSHKLCAHIRRKDFLLLKGYKGMTYEILSDAIKFIYGEIKEATNNAISLILVGDDESFIRNLTFVSMPFTTTTKLNSGKNRGFDMCFAIEYCDTFLLSSSMSTFGWWIGYLMKSQGTVYYDGEVSNDKNIKNLNFNDAFPLNWKRLLYVNNSHFTVS